VAVVDDILMIIDYLFKRSIFMKAGGLAACV